MIADLLARGFSLLILAAAAAAALRLLSPPLLFDRLRERSRTAPAAPPHISVTPVLFVSENAPRHAVAADAVVNTILRKH